jgi:alkyl sulfatase BDS1-like metallo-beta-lactamase superfamily hydrolase
MIRAMTTELWLDFLGIRLDSRKADDKQFKINLLTPDSKEKFVVELSNGTLTNIEGFQADDAHLTITIDREDLEKTMMGALSFDEQIATGKAKLTGNRDVYKQLKSMLVHFDLGFEIMPGTGSKDLTPEQKPFEQEEPARTDGG